MSSQNRRVRWGWPALLLLLACAGRAPDRPSSVPPPDSSATPELIAEVQQLDATFFDAFNSQDLTTVSSMLAPDLEFYHETEGLSGYEQNVEDFRNLFRDDPPKLRRLEPGSMEIYPLEGYGAVVICLQRYCHRDGDGETCSPPARAVMVWRKEGTTWRISRVVSV